jgi:hypothetical protein
MAAANDRADHPEFTSATTAADRNPFTQPTNSLTTRAGTSARHHPPIGVIADSVTVNTSIETAPV